MLYFFLSHPPIGHIIFLFKARHFSLLLFSLSLGSLPVKSLAVIPSHLSCFLPLLLSRSSLLQAIFLIWIIQIETFLFVKIRRKVQSA